MNSIAGSPCPPPAWYWPWSAFPLGLSARKGGKSTGFVLTILLVVVYYFFSMIGVQMARQGKMSPWFGAWMGNIFFFVCGLILLWRVDRMPIEIANLTAGWKLLLQKLQSIGARRRQSASARVSGESSQHRHRFSARFPLILDDMILRDFALYLTLDHGDVPGSGAGLHLLRAAHRHRAQQSARSDRWRSTCGT